jgi:uncharacterized membrane protein
MIALTRKHAGIAVALLWMMAVLIHAWIFITSNVAYVHAHSEVEWYAGSRSFQAFNFCIGRLPLWIAGYLAFLALTGVVRSRRGKKTKDQH